MTNITNQEHYLHNGIIYKKFSKEILKELIYGNVDNYELVANNLIGNSRWSLDYDLIFKHEEKYWRVTYSRGATECQDEQPFEYGNELV